MSAIMPPAVPAQEAEEAADSGVRAYAWTVEAFYRAIESGVFANPQWLELMDGEIIDHMSPQQTPHVQAILLCVEAMRAAFGVSFHVRAQSPLNVNQRTEPEPDVMVIRGALRDYDTRKPIAENVALLLEISDTTLSYDRHRKAAIYAEAGIAEYWLLNLNARMLEARRDPVPMPDTTHGFGYRATFLFAESETVSPLTAPQAVIHVADLLPRVLDEKAKG